MNGDNDVICTSLASLQRRDETLSAGRTVVEQEQEWTTARCQRLLRALTSRVAVLNKEIAKYKGCSKLRQVGERKPYSFPLSETRTPDDEWVVHPRKKVKQTYTTRSRTKHTGVSAQRRRDATNPASSDRTLMPGEVLIPTPFLVRVRDATALEQSTKSLPNILEGKVCQTRRRGLKYYIPYLRTFQWQPFGTLNDLKQRIDGARYAAYEGIFIGLDALIRATGKEETEHNPKKGSRSLFTTALRCVPRYISDQEEALAIFEEETKTKCALSTRDVSTEIYDDLESLGTSGKCWKHLRVVVRSHGMKVICDAIKDGLLEKDFCGILISLLVAENALREADDLVTALLLSSEFQQPKNLNESLDSRLVMLNIYAEHTGRDDFYFRQVSFLIHEGRLPSSWIVTKAFGPIWTKVIQLLSSGNTTQKGVAINFLSIVMPIMDSCTGFESANSSQSATQEAFADAFKTTFYSLLTIISSIYILGHESKKEDASVTLRSSESEYFGYLLGGCMVRMVQLSPSFSNQLAAMVLLQDLSNIEEMHVDAFTNLNQVDRNNIFDLFGPHAQITRDNAQQLASLIGNIARCCGRGALSSGFEYLHKLHKNLEMLNAQSWNRSVIEVIIVDSAYDFASRLPDHRYTSYASEVDEKYASRVKFLNTPNEVEEESSDHSGFRWEEGISEWVVATPAMYGMKRKQIYNVLESSKSTLEPSRHAGFELNLIRQRTPDDDLMGLGGNLEQGSTPTCEDLMFQKTLRESKTLLGQHQSDGPGSQETDLSESESDSAHSTDTDVFDAKEGSVPKKWTTSRRNFWIAQDRSSSSESQRPDASSTELIDKQVGVSIPRPAGARDTPRLHRDWQVFDDNSDDELSFVSVSSEPKVAMQDITNTRVATSRSSQRCGKMTNEVEKPTLKRPKRRLVDLLSDDSEDELCI